MYNNVTQSSWDIDRATISLTISLEKSGRAAQNENKMDGPSFRLHAMILRMDSMYSPKKDWNIFQRFLYMLFRCGWALFLYGSIVLSAMDILAREKIYKISDVAINIMYMAIFGSITIRGTLFISSYKRVDHLATRMDNEFKQETKFAFKTKTMDGAKLAAKRLFLTWMFFVFMAGSLMVLGPLVKRDRTVPMQIWLWYDWNDGNNFYWTMLLQFIALLVMVTSFGNMDMLNASFMILISGQMELLGIDFSNIFNNALLKQGCTEDEIVAYLEYPKKSDSRNWKIDNILETENFKHDLSENLRYCVEHHQKLLDFIDEFQIFISPYLLVTVNCIFSYIIFMLFIAVTTDNTSLYLALSQYVLGSIGQIFIVTYLGENLLTTLENMRIAFYEVPWYLCDQKFLTSYKIVQMRMSKLVGIFAGKLIGMTLNTFMEFMRRAFSFFTVLRQVNNP